MKKILLIIITLFLFPFPGVVLAAENDLDEIAPEKLDLAIESVLMRPEFAWRLPKEKEAGQDHGMLREFVINVFKTLSDLVVKIAKRVDDFISWLDKSLPKTGGSTSHDGGGSGWLKNLWLLFYILLAIVAIAGALMFYRHWHRRRSGVLARSIMPLPEQVMDDEAAAAQLPVAEWIKTAEDYFCRGEFRSAIRAMFLGSLAHLSACEMIVPARGKTNGDYVRELARKARDRHVILDAFGYGVGTAERVWYGSHEATENMAEIFREKLDAILELRRPGVWDNEQHR